MLGLGIDITKACKMSAGSAAFLPSSIAACKLWLQHQNGFTTVGGETDWEVFNNSEVLLSWDDQIGGNNAGNAQNWQRPWWNKTFTAPQFLGTKHFDLDSPIDIAGDFTFSFRLKLGGLVNEGLLGSNNANYFEISSENMFTADIGGTSPDNVFINDYGVLQTATWYSVHFTRTSEILTVHVDGGVFSDVQWGDALPDPDVFTVAGIGSWGDGTQELNGLIKDFSYFEKALNSSERASMNTYLGGL